MLDLLLGIGTIALQVFLLVTIVAWIARAPFASWVARHTHVILRIVFIGAVLGSLAYEIIFHYAPCVLCWYQRLAIFPIALLLWTAPLSKSTLLRLQVLILGSAGLAVSLFHNYISIFPESGLDVCGISGVSCNTLYVFQFGYITIPLMSLTILLAAVLLTLLAGRFPQEEIAKR